MQSQQERAALRLGLPAICKAVAGVAAAIALGAFAFLVFVPPIEQSALGGAPLGCIRRKGVAEGDRSLGGCPVRSCRFRMSRNDQEIAMTRSRSTKQARNGFARLRPRSARVLLVAMALFIAGMGSAWMDLRTSCTARGKPDVSGLDASGPAGTEAPGWPDMLRSINAARDRGGSTSSPSEGGPD